MPRKASTESKTSKTATKTAPKTTAKSSAAEVPSTNSDLLDKVSKLSKDYDSVSVPTFVRSGSAIMDALLGGGIPLGTMITWSSDSGCGKSTGALHIAHAFCAQGYKVLYLDFEGGVNTSQLNNMGLSQYLFDPKANPAGTFYCYMVATYADAEKFLDSMMNEVSLVVIDSATAILTEKIAGESSESIQPGRDSRVMANFLKKYKAAARRAKCTWLIINQKRTQIRFMGVSTEEAAGGLALKFYPDINIMMKKRTGKGNTLERKERTATGETLVPFGAICDIYCTKSRYSRPFVSLPITILFGQGFSNAWSYYDKLIADGTAVKEGAWITLKMGNTYEKFQGALKAVDWIQNHMREVREYIDAHGGFRLLENEIAAPAVDLGSYEDENMSEAYADAIQTDGSDMMEE